jgi:hypothetical protein
MTTTTPRQANEYEAMIDGLRKAGHRVGPDAPRPPEPTESELRKPLTMRAMQLLLRHLAPVIAEAIHERVQRAILPLIARIAELEQRASPKWAGTYASGKTYNEANITTHSGGLWLAQRSTSDRPGASSDWILIVKRGAA